MPLVSVYLLVLYLFVAREIQINENKKQTHEIFICKQNIKERALINSQMRTLSFRIRLPTIKKSILMFAQPEICQQVCDQ